METARAQKLSLDKAARSQQEMLHRAKRAEEELRAAAAAKEALEKAQLGGAAKLAVRELVETASWWRHSSPASSDTHARC